MKVFAIVAMMPAFAVGQLTASEKEKSDALWKPLMTAIGPYRAALESWSVELDSKRWYSQNRIMPTTGPEFKKLIDDLAAVDKIITSEQFAGVKGYWGREDDIIQFPQHWSEITSQRVVITQRVAIREMSRICRPQIMVLQSMTASVRDFDGWGLDESGLQIVLGNRGPARAAATKQAKTIFDAVQLDSANVQVPDFERACDDLVAAAKQAATTAKPAATYSAPAVGDALKKRWASGTWNSRKILSVKTESNVWKVTKNSLGTPLYRTVAVVVQFTLPNNPQKVEYSTQIKENYIGSGKYQYVTSNISPEYRIVSK